MKTRILTAGSDILYHGTTPENAISILRDKKFVLKSSFMNEFESKLGPNMFYLSTARSLQSYYLKRRKDRGYIIFELNGRQLGSRYQIKPVMYFDRSYGENEMEDRVFSTSASIPIKYVTAIHVPVGDDDYMSPRSYSAILKRLALKVGIPIYFYDTMSIQHFRHPRIQVGLNKVVNPESNMSGYVNAVIKQNFETLRILLLPISRLPKHSAIVSSGWTLLSSGFMGTYSYFESTLKSLSQSVLNMRSLGHDYTDVIERLSHLVRKHSWNTRDLYLYLRAKLEYALTGGTYFDLITMYQAAEPTLSKEYLDKGQAIARRWAQLTRALYTEYDNPLVGEKQVHKETGNKMFLWTQTMNNSLLRQVSQQYRNFQDNRSS